MRWWVALKNAAVVVVMVGVAVKVPLPAHVVNWRLLSRSCSGGLLLRSMVLGHLESCLPEG